MASLPKRGALIALGIVAATIYSVNALNLDLARLRGSWRNLHLITDKAWPLDWSVLDVAWLGIRETLHIAFLGTMLGLVFALPIALLASRNLFPNYVGVPARLLLSGMRVVPSLLWAILFAIVLGLGSLVGVVAIALYTIGFLGKLQYEAIEGLPQEPFEAMEAMGATRLQTLVHVVIPEAANALLSQVLFLFEYNVRHSSVIGVVGAGGIGTYLMGYLRFFQYDKVFVLLICIFALVVGIDIASRWLRRNFLDDDAIARRRARRATAA